MIDKKFLSEFRGEINLSDWCYFKYKNNNNRNQWNCICSAMDWIEVSAEYICAHPLSSIKSHQSIELYSYLSCVDIIVEAIEQLHRVIFSTRKQVFENESDCFGGNQFHQNDRMYFKTLRACFGAHPVNLDDPDDIEAKRFASWSGGGFGTNNFSVILYSNKPNGQYITLGMKFAQVDHFVEKYYNHLIALKQELHLQDEKFRKKKAKNKIERCNDPVEQLKILKKESSERLNNDYYRITIDDLLLMYETPISCEENADMVLKYRKALIPLIKEIYGNLQNMTLVDLQYDNLLSPTPDTLPNGWGYCLEKLSNAVNGSGYPEFVWIDMVENHFGDKFVFEYESIQELYVLVHALLSQMSDNPQGDTLWN